MIDVQTIITRIRTEELSPTTLSEYRLHLAAEYSYQAEQLREVLKEKANRWLEIRQRHEITSDKLADRIWESTDFGKKETDIKLLLKSIDKLMSGINGRLRTFEDEAKHII